MPHICMLACICTHKMFAVTRTCILHSGVATLGRLFCYNIDITIMNKAEQSNYCHFSICMGSWLLFVFHTGLDVELMIA